MASKNDWLGLGMPYPQANRLGFTPVIATAAGQTSGSATPIGGVQFITFVNASNSGSGLLLPQVVGDNGALIGDEFNIFNNLSATIAVYAANTAQGSAVTLSGNANSVAGTTGVSLATGQMMTLFPVTVSTWILSKTSV